MKEKLKDEEIPPDSEVSHLKKRLSKNLKYNLSNKRCLTSVEIEEQYEDMMRMMSFSNFGSYQTNPQSSRTTLI